MEYILFACLLAASVSSSPLSENQRSTIEDLGITSSTHQATSPFKRIIRTNEIATPDAIYSTPAVVYVGKLNKLLRCLYEDPNRCEVVFNTTDDYVSSLLVFEEHIYASLGSGVILRCNLNREEPCLIFQTGESPIWSMERAGKHLFVGLGNGTILRCDLNELNSCQPLHVLGNSVLALVHYNEYIYAGIKEEQQLWRCSLTTINSCTLVYDVNAMIFGLSNVGNSILGVGSGYRMLNCTKKPNTDMHCELVTMQNLGTQYITSFNGIVYTVRYNRSIHICEWPHTECTEYVHMRDILSIAFAYSTFELQSRYANENSECTWQRGTMCTPGVIYYNAEQRATMQVEVKDGRLYNSVGALVDTSNADEGKAGPAAIFVMMPDGRLLLSNSHKRGLVHTSSLFAGKPVAGAGEMTVKNGVIQEIRACSEHYRPNVELNRQVVVSLRAQGYTDRIDSVECDDDVTGQTTSETVH